MIEPNTLNTDRRHPRVSVVIPAFNAEKFLGQAIESAMAQTYRDHEIIVVNDGSTDDTQAIINRYAGRVCGLAQRNAGLAAARNTGAAAATGTYLAFLDADDTFKSDKLSLQVAAMDSNPDLALVASGLDVVDAAGRTLAVVRPWVRDRRIDLNRLTFQGLVGVHGTLVRKAWFDQVGGFNTLFRYCEDMDFWWRLHAAGGQMAWLTTIVGDYRIHGSNMSQSVLEHHRWRVDLLQQHRASDKLSDGSKARIPEVIAQLKVAAAGRLYDLGDSAAAAALLVEASRLDPRLLDQDGMGMLDAMVCWQDDPWIRNRGSVLDTCLAALPSELGWLAMQAPRLETRYWRRQFYLAVTERQGSRLRRAWVAMASRDPSWLANRGSWALLARSILFSSQWRPSTPLLPEVIR